MNKTLLVDAQNLLKSSFHGNQTTYSKSFGYIGSLVTFYTVIRKVIRDQKINKVILFWDGVNSGQLRHDIYPEYKSNRKHKKWNGDSMILSEKDIEREENSDKSILIQRERIKKYAEELFFRQVEDEIVEADDCIAYYCLEQIQPDEKVIILSADEDFCQLISDKVYLYLNQVKTKGLISPNTYRLYFDHHQANSVLIKALCGCKTDMVYGVEGLGEKTLLNHFPELMSVPVTFDHILQRSKEINEGRKKPLQALSNIIKGKTSIHQPNVLTGKHLYELNNKLVNLHEPFMTEEAKENVEANTTYPISDNNRGGKNLLRLMYEDGFINAIPGGADGYRNFLIDFLPIVQREKYLYAQYLKSL